jgi:hypothetical protein
MSSGFMTPLLTPLLLGLAASLHCVGMCGPLLLALPPGSGSRWAALRNMLIYHAGRTLTYVALGVLLGLAGKSIALAGFQKSLSVGAGVLMLFLAFSAWRFERVVAVLPGFGVAVFAVKSRIGRMLKRHPNGASFGIGLLNGLLPCGMVYAALAGAVSTADGAAGGLFMAVFGMGTIPMLLAVSLTGRSVGAAMRQKIKFAQPLLLTLAALLLLQRGLHLDISLFESAVPKADFECH